jgi:pimeloyl-ACP methyl ester carboxylesterase
MKVLLLLLLFLQQPLGIELQEFKYPYPVQFFSLTAQQQNLRMAYMDIKPETPNGKTVMLLHGKNFFGAYWENVISRLSSEGFRVIVPDQIGFGKSSKPEIFQYSFHQLARNTKALLDQLGVSRLSVAGHSMGGMLAIRFTLMYPETVEKLVLENPIGLEDYKLKVPYQTLDELLKEELQVNLEKLVNYQKTNYYHGTWKKEYARWVEPFYLMSLSPDFPRMALNSALAYDMIYTQPVVYELGNIRVPTILIIGQLDRTALGKNRVSEEVARTMGNYPELGKRVSREIPGAKLVELEGIGHIPHIEAPDAFVQPFLAFLKNQH